MSLSLTEKIKICNEIQGMCGNLSLATMDTLLCFQNQQNIVGNILEIGVFKGKTAKILSFNCQDTEQLYLVDPVDNFDHTNISSTTPNFKFLKQTSKIFNENITSNMHSAFRMIHMDPSHMFEDTIIEMSICEKLLSDGGIAIFDDVVNPAFMQCTAAMYKYLYTQPTNLTIFLYSNNKAFLCKKEYYNIYKKFLLTQIQSVLAQDNIYTQLSRTDKELEEFKAFGLLPCSQEVYNTTPLYHVTAYKPFYK